MTATLKNGGIYFCRLNTTTQRIELYSKSMDGNAEAELEEKGIKGRDFLFNNQRLFTVEEIILNVTSIDYVSLSTNTIDFRAKVELDKFYIYDLIRQIDFIPSQFYEEDKAEWWSDILYQIMYYDLDTQSIFDKVVMLDDYAYDDIKDELQRLIIRKRLNKIIDYLELIR